MERVIERILRLESNISKNQLELKAIYIIRRFMKRYRENMRDLHLYLLG